MNTCGTSTASSLTVACANPDEMSGETVNEMTFALYPNPANEEVTIDCSTINASSGSIVRIYNTIGELVYQTINNNTKSTIAISSFAKGIYTVVVENENGRAVKKLVVE